MLDAGLNMKRLRWNRCTDEEDLIHSSNPTHAARLLAFRSEEVRDEALSSLAPAEHAEAKEARAQRKDKTGKRRELEADLKEVASTIERLERGEEAVETVASGRGDRAANRARIRSIAEEEEPVRRCDRVRGVRGFSPNKDFS